MWQENGNTALFTHKPLHLYLTARRQIHIAKSPMTPYFATEYRIEARGAVGVYSGDDVLDTYFVVINTWYNKRIAKINSSPHAFGRREYSNFLAPPSDSKVKSKPHASMC